MTFIFFRTERFLQRIAGDARRAGKAKRHKRLWLTSAICLIIAVAVLGITFSGMGIISQVQAGANPANTGITGMSPRVLQDAINLAEERYGEDPRAGTYRDQVLIAYEEARDKDVVILFNPGGWGTKTLQASPDWVSIVEGMQEDISALGYRVSTLNFLRTVNNLRGQLNEFKEMVTGYQTKAGDLAELVNFLTEHNPGLKVILAAESTGTIICDETMQLLQNNTRVFSVQTGPPFWHKHAYNARTILLKDNGKTADAFARGDLWTILKCSLKSMIGKDKEESEGTVLGFLSAPGHEYWWDDPGVCPTIGPFLKESCQLSCAPKTE